MEVAEFRGRVMASELLVLALVEDRQLLGRAGDELKRLETLWSRFSPTSEISLINRSDGRPVRVASETLSLVGRMIDGWRMTEGVFNPTILARLVDNGYGASRVEPERITVMPRNPLGIRPLSEIVISTSDSTVTVPAGFALDPGGIGKGFAADLVVDWLLTNGAAGALVSIGGDMAMAGQSPGPDGWIVDVEHADPADGILCSLAINHGGVATSNTTSRQWRFEGHDHHHLVDAATGHETETDLVAATVVAPAGWQAEVFAKAALLGGSNGFIDELEKRGFEGLAITKTGHILCTYEFAEIELRPKAGAS